jgi:protein-S-isoprenylcysteine O-methyltransferase Ste14
MTMPTLWQIDMIPWFVFVAYWLITALRVRRTKASETDADRFATIAVLCVAYILLFTRKWRVGPLHLRFVPAEAWIAQMGIFLTCLGVAIAIWARRTIGEYWSARVTLKEDHRLISSGPYRSVRHPIYTGMLLATAGTALVIGEWRGVLALALILVAHSRKALREEALLTREFGDEYTAYREHTGFLFPGL